LQNLLGLAAVGGGLYKNLGGSTGVSNLWNGASNWLSGTSDPQQLGLDYSFVG
jgi:hypothetical protein